MERGDVNSRGVPEYWRSLDELADSPAFRRWVEREFPGLDALLSSGPTRRQFLRFMGASLALGGLTGCRWPKETIVPATRQSAERPPGAAVQYATALERGAVATGVLVTSYDGRPIKIEGNDKHPFSRGKTSAWMQAAILELYDPDRSPQVLQRVGQRDRPAHVRRSRAELENFLRAHFERLRGTGGAELCVLAEPSSSPSLAQMRARFAQAFPQAEWYEYEPLSRDNERAGARLAFGRPYRTHLHLDRADVIVSLDSDFLMTHPAAVRYASDFAARRRPDASNNYDCNRLYVLESGVTVTGSVADRRIALRASELRAALEQISAAVVARLGPSSQPGPLAGAGGLRPLPEKLVASIAADLCAHRGRCAVVVGPRQPAEVHALAHWLNGLLEAHGHTITFTADPDEQRPDHWTALGALVRRIDAGQVDTLVILGGNPSYDAPADLALDRGRFDRIATSIHLSPYVNETSLLSDWHVPQAHILESWGDARAWDGTLSIVQPLIEPLYGGLTPIELLALLTNDRLTSGHDIVRRTFGELFDAGHDRARLWEQSLHDGVVPDTAWPTETPTLQAFSLGSAEPATGTELVFAEDYSVYDGRLANNAWLQEWPDPITKLTWGNAALLSPADAGRLGVQRNGDILVIEAAQSSGASTSVRIPAYVLPGHAEDSITLPIGYGRTAAGAVGDGMGVDVSPLRRSSAPYIAVAARVARTGQHCELAGTQDHHAIRSRVGDREEQARIPVLIREAELGHYRAHPDFARHVVHEPAPAPLWKEKEYDGHKWGLAIDLSACIGCGACVLACQAENNIPVVGPEEVRRGREMHWIRVDRYFRTADGMQTPGATPPVPSTVAVVHQPVTCVHCENAPCEQVCPVAATVHDEEGLNVMVYNRCVGTRYCSNNCPFKVRRFNWFYNHHGPYHPRSIRTGVTPLPVVRLPRADLTEIEKMAYNPQVTVRSRGVMEKCTFCVQRINAVKIKARNEKWPTIPDGLIQPACVQACPTEALVFGDLNDPQSRVRRLHEHPRAYELLAELNLKSRTRYLARIRNTGAGHDSDALPGNERHGERGT